MCLRFQLSGMGSELVLQRIRLSAIVQGTGCCATVVLVRVVYLFSQRFPLPTCQGRTEAGALLSAYTAIRGLSRGISYEKVNNWSELTDHKLLCLCTEIAVDFQQV